TSKSGARTRAADAPANIAERRSDMFKNNKWFLSVPLAVVLAAGMGLAKAHVTDSQIVAEIQDHLYHAHIYKQGDVRVSFENDIGRFLDHVKGVAELENDLEVLPTSNYDDQLRIAIARAIYGDPYFVHYGNQALPPIHIIVKNGNVTLVGVVNNQVDRAKAEADARFAATFFALTNDLRVERG